MARFGITWLFGGVVLLVAPLLNSQSLQAQVPQGEPASTTAAEEKPAAKPTASEPPAGKTSAEGRSSPAATMNLDELKRDIARRLDTMDARDLMNKMARAQAVLGLEGQSMLKDQAVLRRERQKAFSILKVLADDPQLKGAESLFANESFRSELLEALNRSDEKEQLKAVSEILDKHNVVELTLQKMVQQRQLSQNLGRYESGLKGIENALSLLQEMQLRAKGQGVGSGLEIPAGGGSLELADTWANRKTVAGGQVPATDLRAILKSLLDSNAISVQR